MNRKLIAAIVLIIAACIGLHFYVEWEKARFDASLPQPPPEPTDEQSGSQQADELIPSIDWQQHTELPELVKPDNLSELDPADPVAKAWAKLDYIADNPFAWGGNADPRTAALVQQLMPPPEYLVDEAHGEQVGDLLDELAYLRDPRSIETLTVYECGDNIGSARGREALVAMGPPTVPYLIPYLDEALKAKEDSMGLYVAADVLSQIGAQCRADLDGIIEYIILPKFAQLLANESLSPYGKERVKEAIARLKSTRPQ